MNTSTNVTLEMLKVSFWAKYNERNSLGQALENNLNTAPSDKIRVLEIQYKLNLYLLLSAVVLSLVWSSKTNSYREERQ